MRLAFKSYLLPFLAAATIVGVILLDPVPQDPAYHNFADDQAAFGIRNFLNVISNIFFLLIGSAGLWFLHGRDRVTIVNDIYPAYLVFFAGVTLTAFGSAWYHLAPANGSLFWDRLPMTLAFMSLFTIIIGEQVSAITAKRLFLPLLLVGAASVMYWAITESRGAGDLRFYAIVQFLPLLLIPLLLLLYRSPFERSGFFWGMIGLYAASKILEMLDRDIYELVRIFSGHSMKHVVAALAPLLFLYGIVSRGRRQNDVPNRSNARH